MDSKPLPEEIVLGPSRWKWLSAAIVSMVLVVAGLAVIPYSFLLSVLIVVLFGGGAAMSIVQLTHYGSRLHLKWDGFDQVLLDKTVSYTWGEVSEFGVWGKEHGFAKDEFVSFEYVGAEQGPSRPVGAGDGQSTLGDTFGKEAKDLAALMNAFRDRALAARRAHDDDI